MTKIEFENRSLVVIVLVGYAWAMVLGALGALYPLGSNEHRLLFQINNAFAISASVMTARYIGLRGQQVAASGCILLGIAHGISLAALSRAGIDPTASPRWPCP